MEVAAALVKGNVAAGARAMRWLDDRDPRGADVVSAVIGHTGGAHVVGLTGPPGAGKSTLASALIAEARRREHRVGVVAVDPSSPFTGGAILGDRVRMARHALDPDVFIRSVGTRGQAGGLSRSTHDTCLILDAMGYDLILVETVGVGQDEIEIVALAHTTVIVGLPGLGDEVQAVKAGLMEVGEIIVINKADREGLDHTLQHYETMLHLRASAQPDAPDAWTPPLLTAVATREEGTAAVVDAIEAHGRWLRANGEFAARSGRRARAQAMVLLRDRLSTLLDQHADPQVLAAVEARELDVYSAADALLAGLREALRRG